MWGICKLYFKDKKAIIVVSDILYAINITIKSQCEGIATVLNVKNNLLSL